MSFAKSTPTRVAPPPLSATEKRELSLLAGMNPEERPRSGSRWVMGSALQRQHLVGYDVAPVGLPGTAVVERVGPTITFEPHAGRTPRPRARKRASALARCLHERSQANGLRKRAGPSAHGVEAVVVHAESNCFLAAPDIVGDGAVVFDDHGDVIGDRRTAAS